MRINDGFRPRLCENCGWVRILRGTVSGVGVKRFIEGRDRWQGVLLPEYLGDYVSEENPVRVVEAFIDELDLAALGFTGVVPEPTGRPAYHPAVLLKIYPASAPMRQKWRVEEGRISGPS